MKKINKNDFIKAKVNIKKHPAVILFPAFDTSKIAS